VLHHYETIAGWQSDVEKDEIRNLNPGESHSSNRVGSEYDRISACSKSASEAQSKITVVLYDKNFFFHTFPASLLDGLVVGRLNVKLEPLVTGLSPIQIRPP